MLRPKAKRSIFFPAAAVAVLTVPSFLCGQTIPADSQPAKSYTFDIISIRQNKGVEPPQMPRFTPTADGYQAENLSLLVSILRAYVPLTNTQGYYTMDRIKGAPDWLTTTNYNIEAKVSEADLAEWQKPESQKVMLPAMLQAALIERCKLEIHRESKESTVFNLTVARSGLKIKKTAPDAKAGPGIALPAGGTLMPGPNGRSLAFYGASMVSVAQVLSNFAGYPVVDKTGLTGKYDFVLEREEQPEGAPPNPGPPTYAVDALGLHLDRSKSVVDTLVIDHIERPTEN